MLRLHVIRSTHELRRVAERWDDLWLRSEVAAPSARAAMVALWVDHFVPHARFQAVVVEQDGRYVAALPLVMRSLHGVVNVAALPCNDWAASGDLLLDESSDVEVVLQMLVSALARIGGRLLWFEQVALEASRWQAFLAACARGGLSASVREHFRVAQVEITGTWDQYEASRKGDHRRSRRRYAKLLEQAGGVELKSYRPAPDQVQSLIRLGFEVENRSWKGANGTSVMKTPGLLEFLSREAKILAQWQQLELNFLEHQGQPIAFEYGWPAKHVHFLPKLGYDDAFSKYGPGQQLIMRVLENLHSSDETRLFDFWGPMVSWNESWATRSYAVGRLVVAAPGPVSRGLFHAYENWHPRWRRLRQRLRKRPVVQGSAT